MFPVNYLKQSLERPSGYLEFEAPGWNIPLEKRCLNIKKILGSTLKSRGALKKVPYCKL
jgi:hypothetical protein